ncbi:MAG TPA: DUF4402 domain-containing protein [Sphingomicrobium sp.]|nr:DUF4402 domain-containing protein [Sphingomicrobium sp.]
MTRACSSLLPALLMLALPRAAEAAPPQEFVPDRDATGVARVILPAQITKLYDLDFGFLTVTTAGSAIVDSTAGNVSTTGGVLFAGGLPHAALFEAVSPSKTVVHIRLPKKAETLTRVGGTETMSVDGWTLNGAETRNVVAHETFEFAIGATLHVGAGQVEGTYTGSFDVTIDYN